MDFMTPPNLFSVGLGGSFTWMLGWMFRTWALGTMLTASNGKGDAASPLRVSQRKARWFSQYLTKLSKACQVSLPLQHASPNGTAIAFWTTTLPIRAELSRTEALDSWFGRHMPCASRTSDLRKINMWILWTSTRRRAIPCRGRRRSPRPPGQRAVVLTFGKRAKKSD